MNVPLHIAWRYLFAKKNHNVINIISVISAVGICIGAMALVVILSVYNGFDGIIQQFYTQHQASYLVEPKRGKSFELDARKVQMLRLLQDRYSTSNGDVYVARSVNERVFIQYNGRQRIATAIGIDTLFGKKSSLIDVLIDGKFLTRFGEVPTAVVTRNLGASMGINPAFNNPIELYYPSRSSSISLINPLSSLNMERVYPEGIIKDVTGYDSDIIFVDIPLLQSLIEYEPLEYSNVQIYAMGNIFLDEVGGRLKEIFPDEEFSVMDVYGQNEVLFKMMNMEKGMVYLILFFVIFIVAINILSSLSMLILEKRGEMTTFRSMGMTERGIKRIFTLQGILISIFGALVGIVLGIILCIMQEKLHLIALPGNYLTPWYPVQIRIKDIIVVFLGVCAIGTAISSSIRTGD